MRRFLITWLAITALCWTVVGALVAPMVPGGGWLVAAAAVLLSAPILVLLRGFSRPAYPRRSIRLFVIRPFWYVQLLLPFAAIAAVAGVVLGGLAGSITGQSWKWAVGGGQMAILVLAGVAAPFLAAGYIGSRRLVVRHHVAHVPRLPDGFDGMRIVQLTDLHVGPHTSRAKLARIAGATREARPDLIALTGDLVDDYARDVEPFEAGLGHFSAPLGVYAIAGNHDVYAGWALVRSGLEAQGITVLVNSAVALERGGDRIALIGTGDPAGRQWQRGGGDAAAPDIARAVAAGQALTGTEGVLLALAHNPALWPPLAKAGIGLTLSGHTHWGQLAVPWLHWSLASPFLAHAMGAYVAGDAVLYVHPGTNYWGLPFRLGTPPEVAVITLRRGAPGFAEER